MKEVIITFDEPRGRFADERCWAVYQQLCTLSCDEFNVALTAVLYCPLEDAPSGETERQDIAAMARYEIPKRLESLYRINLFERLRIHLTECVDDVWNDASIVCSL